MSAKIGGSSPRAKLAEPGTMAEVVGPTPRRLLIAVEATSARDDRGTCTIMAATNLRSASAAARPGRTGPSNVMSLVWCLSSNRALNVFFEIFPNMPELSARGWARLIQMLTLRLAGRHWVAKQSQGTKKQGGARQVESQQA